MKPIRTIFAVGFALLALPLSAVGQESEAAGDAETVISDKSLADLRRDAFDAEEEFYAIYNKLNDDKDYDVRCRYERPTGTYQKNHVCRARFVTKAYSAHAARNRNDLSRVANQGSDPVMMEKTAKYEEIMETLIAANPELQAALIRYNTAREAFFAKREAFNED